ncbi:hypothetical protein [Variovorax sp. IB41]|uniref:hypothetical protein n=1 Tax=Variovorax sp. IB41 TaxID=2779370 RepID=UPI0018E7B21C|nr:hypothetical protein [Variovorax sp. IB41]MBJ2158544.1 hypothetical protein [Variovorax sp. IB41]
MKSKFLCFVVFFHFAFPAFAKDMVLESKNEFRACMQETKPARNDCNFGGCGNIAGTCYERQLNEISSATQALTKKLNAGRCKQAANSASDEVDDLDAKLKLLTPFDGTWSGYDIQVEVALLKNRVMNALATECEISE